MSEIIFRLPSKATQYGYVEIKFEHTELAVPPTANAVGDLYTRWVADFQAAEMKAKKAAAPPDPELVDTSLAERNLKRQPMAEPTQEEAQTMISQGLDEKAPWEETVTADPKPWEKKSPAPKPVANLLDTL